MIGCDAGGGVASFVGAVVSSEIGATVSRFTYTSSTSPPVVTVRANTISMIPDSLPLSISTKASVIESLKCCVNSMKKDPSGTPCRCLLPAGKISVPCRLSRMLCCTLGVLVENMPR